MIPRGVLGLLFFLGLTFCAAWVGARFLPGEWYAGLRKPVWNPPDWIFAPVWTLLYTLMAVSAWLVWHPKGARAVALGLGLYVLQLLFNAMWSWLFFGLHRTGLALAEILLLWCCITAMVIVFWKLDWRAGTLLLPYLLWVSFATVLNATLWWLNRALT